MNALLAGLPIAVCIALMGGLNWPARRALPVSWLLGGILAFAAWGMPVRAIAAHSLFGALKALDILLILYGALVLLQVVRASGAMEIIAHGFDGLTRDARYQAILIGWLFGAFIEGMAGYGTPAALATPLLMGLGFPPLAAAATALLYNCTPVSFAAGGVPIEAAMSTLHGLVPEADAAHFAHALGARVALLHGIAGTFLPLAGVCLLTRGFGPERSIKPGLAAAPFAIFAGLSFTVPSVFTAYFLGPEFPSIFGAIAGLGLCMGALRLGFFAPKTPWRFAPSDDWPAEWRGLGEADGHNGPNGQAETGRRPLSLLRACAPYALIAAILLLTRVPALGLRAPLRALTLTTPEILGEQGLRYSLAWAFNPGILPFLLVALIAWPLQRLSAPQMRAAFAGAVRQVFAALPALVCGVALVQLMLATGDAQHPGMTASLAQGVAGVAGAAFPFFSPFIGLLGAMLSGSNTVSNILFAAFQYKTAALLHLAPLAIVAMQIAGGAAGSMMGFNTTVAACEAAGLRGREGALLRRNAPVALAYVVAIALLGLMFTAL